TTCHFRTHLQKILSTCPDLFHISESGHCNTRRHLTEIVSDQVYDCHMLGQLFLVRQNLFPRIGYARVDRTLHRERSDDSVVDSYESLRGENEKLVFVQQLVFCPTYMKQFVQGA